MPASDRPDRPPSVVDAALRTRFPMGGTQAASGVRGRPDGARAPYFSVQPALPVTVNAVAPGAARTATNGSAFEAPGLADLIVATTALDRLGGPDDVADVVAFLASDAARWITGQVIDAGGGLFLGPRA